MSGGGVLSARGIGLHYGARAVLSGVDVDVAPGVVHVIIGPNGSGKSSLVRVLAGVSPPSHGEVTLAGRSLASVGRRERGQRIALVPQETRLAFPLTVAELARLGRAPHLGRFGFESPADSAAVRAAMARTDVADLAARFVHTLSGGERQRAVLARALAQEPAILLLDEPTAFLDVRHAVEICTLARDLAHRHGLAVLLVLHDLNLAALFADRVTLLRDGRVHRCGPPGEVLTGEDLRTVYGTELRVDRHPDSGLVSVLPVAPREVR